MAKSSDCADEQSSRLEAVVEGNYKTLHGEIGTLETTTKAGFEAQQTVNEATTRQFSEFNQTIIGLDGKIEKQVSALASFETKTNDKLAEAVMKAEFNAYKDNTSQSIASVKAYADSAVASIDVVAKLNGSGSAINVRNYSCTIGSTGSYGSGSQISVDTYGDVSIGSTNVTRISGSSGIYLQSPVYFNNSTFYYGGYYLGLHNISFKVASGATISFRYLGTSWSSTGSGGGSSQWT